MKKQVDFKLLPEYSQEYGHCQITYKCKNDHGQTIYYCLQDNHELNLLRYTQDGEPEYIVKLKDEIMPIFERPKIKEHDSNYVIELKNKVNAWIDNLVKEGE